MTDADAPIPDAATDAPQPIDLPREVASLKQEPGWLQGDRAVRSLVATPHMRVVMLALRTEARLREHEAPGALSIHVLEGAVRISALGLAHTLQHGAMLALDPGVRHEVEALEESVLLLTIALVPTD